LTEAGYFFFKGALFLEKKISIFPLNVQRNPPLLSPNKKRQRKKPSGTGLSLEGRGKKIGGGGRGGGGRLNSWRGSQHGRKGEIPFKRRKRKVKKEETPLNQLKEIIILTVRERCGPAEKEGMRRSRISINSGGAIEGFCFSRGGKKGNGLQSY